MTRTLAAITALVPLLPFAAAGPFIARNQDATTLAYPYALHLPDRTTRSLPPLQGPPPAILFLTGSGARGTGANATYLAGYDGVGRRIREYNAGNTTDRANQIAAEEFLTIIPIHPDDIPQSQGPQWNVGPFPDLLEQVYAEFPYDRNRLSVAGYSMGAHAGFVTIVENPTRYAGFVASGGSTSFNASTLQVVQHLPIRQLVAENDEKSAASQADAVQQEMDSLGPNNTTMTTYTGLDHIQMSDIPWNEDVMQWLTTLVRTSSTNDTSAERHQGSIGASVRGTVVDRRASIGVLASCALFYSLS